MIREKHVFLWSLILSIIVIVFFFGTSDAFEGDRSVELVFSDSGDVVSLGRGHIRGGDIWVPVEIVRRIGVALRDGPNSKGFILDVKNPAAVFEIPIISMLAGDILPLYFPSMVEDGVSYFNIRGMEQITNILVEEKNTEVMLYRQHSSIRIAPKSAGPDNEIKGKLLLVWAHITRDNPDIEAEQKIEGLDVISPTWFNLMDGNGNMANRGSAAYVDSAHKKGYKVWALVSNGFSKINTTQFFENPKAVHSFIARILVYSKLYNLDGVNLDFENVDVKDRDKYVSFIAQLGRYLRIQGLKSSVDVHVPGNSNLSRSHDRGELAKHVDYVMLMAYDEHWRTSPKAGSVASLPWVERAVQNTLKEGVPPKKLVLGVPFYMRRWEETPVGGGKIKVKGYTQTMPESDAIVILRGISPLWMDNLGQYFYSYVLNGKTYKVWVENEQSIERKMQLVNKYGLAGAAGWRKGHEKPEIWPVIKYILDK